MINTVGKGLMSKYTNYYPSSGSYVTLWNLAGFSDFLNYSNTCTKDFYLRIYGYMIPDTGGTSSLSLMINGSGSNNLNTTSGILERHIKEGDTVRCQMNTMANKGTVILLYQCIEEDFVYQESE